MTANLTASKEEDIAQEGTFPGYDNYVVFSDGTIYSKFYNRPISCKGDKNGYLRVGLTNPGGLKTFKIHRVVLTTFSPVPGMESLEVNHKNGNKQDNKLSNLEWVTSEENIQHAIQNGLRREPGRGIHSTRSFLKYEDLVYIFEMKLAGYTNRYIAKELGTKDFNVNQILAGKRYIGDFRKFREELIAKGIVPDYKYKNGIRIK